MYNLQISNAITLTRSFRVMESLTPLHLVESAVCAPGHCRCHGASPQHVCMQGEAAGPTFVQLRAEQLIVPLCPCTYTIGNAEKLILTSYMHIRNLT